MITIQSIRNTMAVYVFKTDEEMLDWFKKTGFKKSNFKIERYKAGE